MQLQCVAQDRDLVLLRTRGSITPEVFAREQEPIGQLLGTHVYRLKMLLDLSDSEYMNSSGIAWLLTVHKRCRDQGGQLILHSLTPGLSDVLSTLRMDRVFQIVGDELSARVAADGVA